MHLSGLFIYPVKSLRGIAVTSAQLDALGLAGDRRFMVVDEAGRFLTQRTLPHMALIRTALSPDELILSRPDIHPLHVSRASDPNAALANVSVWNSQDLMAEDCGAESAAWLTDVLCTPCRLVRAGAKFHRPVNKPGNAHDGDIVSFADAYPLLVISEASLTHLNDRLAERDEPAVPMDRFRPNLVISGVTAHDEDQWLRIKVGDCLLRAGGPCARCVITTTDQETAHRGPEPLRTLATYRRDAAKPTDVNFGQNFFHETKSGTLRIGDHVEIVGLRRR